MVKPPQGWPLPELKVPPGATRAKLFGLQESLSVDEGYTIQGAPDAGDFEGELWAMAFDSEMGWQEIVQYVETALRKQGFSALENPLNGSPSPDWPAFQYLAADGRMLVLVARSQELSGKDGAHNICLYKLTVLKEIYTGSDYRRAL